MALYRKYRPQTFDDFVNQEQVKTALKNSIDRNDLSHAYVFSGPRGTGKTSMARVFARTLGIKELDLIEIDGATYTQVDNMRDLLDKVSVAPSQSPYKVYVIDEVHMLSNHSFNALLKTLEEPPAHVIFILVTTELQKIPLTVLSRCQRFEFRQLNLVEIATQVMKVGKQEGRELSPSVAELIAEAAGGSLRDALAHFEQLLALGVDNLSLDEVAKSLGVVDRASIRQLTEFLIKKDAISALNLVEDLYHRGFDPVNLVRTWARFCQTLIYAQIEGSSKDELVSAFSIQALAGMLKKMVELEGQLKTSSLALAPIQVFILEWCGVDSIKTPQSDTSKDVRPDEKPEPKNVEKSTGDSLESDSPTGIQFSKSTTTLPANSIETWQKIVSLVKVNHPYVGNILQQASFFVDEGKVSIEVKSAFLAGVLNKNENLSDICASVDEALGEKMPVKVQVNQDLSPTIPLEKITAPIDLEDVSKAFNS